MAPTNYAEVFKDLASIISDTAERKGFWDYDEEEIGNLGIIPLKLALIHDEVSEALQVHRKEYDDAEEDPISRMTPMQEDDFFEEIADVIIRCLDVVGAYENDIGSIIIDKMETNTTRPHRHERRY